MNKFKKLFAICLIVAIGLGAVKNFTLYASETDVTGNTRRSQVLSNSITGNQLFAVFGGGWSSIRYQICYYEYYKSRGFNNEFPSRIATFLYSASGATSTPYVTFGGVKHYYEPYYKKEFNNWNKQETIYGGEWNGGFGKRNDESVVYSAETAKKGKLSFLLSCPGGTPSIVPGSVDLPLRTH